VTALAIVCVVAALGALGLLGYALIRPEKL
jgi:hypothetical protein